VPVSYTAMAMLWNAGFEKMTRELWQLSGQDRLSSALVDAVTLQPERPSATVMCVLTLRVECI
jgi:hypothetical protein